MCSLQYTLINWYDKNHRDLPWRHNPSPYEVWLSEVILQQTRVNQGRDYYLRFVERWPEVADLANASDKEFFRDAIFLCGNAPLALAGVAKLYAEQGIRPALIVGMPVGFVNVVESKKLLDGVKVPWIRLNGRRGGSPFAVATLHGIMENELK